MKWVNFKSRKNSGDYKIGIEREQLPEDAVCVCCSLDHLKQVSTITVHIYDKGMTNLDMCGQILKDKGLDLYDFVVEA